MSTQRRDAAVNDIIQYWLAEQLPSGLKGKQLEEFEKQCRGFEVLDGVLYRKVDGQSVVVMPDLYKETMLHRFHTSVEGMHQGQQKVIQNLLRVCWWEGLRQDVIHYIEDCPSCAQLKNSYRRIRVQLRGQVTTYPMESVSTDIAGPLPVTQKGNRWFIVFIDMFIKFVEIFPLKDARAETVAHTFVTEYVTGYSLPRQLLSNRGTNYMSTLLQEIYRLLEVRHKRTMVYHPATNGQSERIIKVIKYCLAQTVNSTHTGWDQQLPFIRMVINQSWHTTTNSSLAMLWFSREMMTPTRMLLPGKKEPMAREGGYPERMEQKMMDVWNAVRAYMNVAKGAQKFYCDQKVVATTIDVGDWVYRCVPRGKPGLVAKLVRKWTGPYIVVRKAEEVAWIPPIQKPHREPESVHLNMLKKYSGVNVPPKDDQDPSTDDKEEEDGWLENTPGTEENLEGTMESSHSGATEPMETRADSVHPTVDFDDADAFMTLEDEQAQKEEAVQIEQAATRRPGLRQRPPKRRDGN